MALRFARVLRYRDDKSAAEADTIDTVRASTIAEAEVAKRGFPHMCAPSGASIETRHGSRAETQSSRRRNRDDTMATPTAAPSERIEETDGDITYVRTDKDLPPVAIIDRSPITTKHKIVFAVIALLGAIAWAMIAFFRGETVNAVWFVIAAVCTYVIGYRFYARLIEMKIVTSARRQRHAGRGVRERHRLHADRPAGAVRSPLRRDRRRGSAGRARCWPCRWAICRAPSGSSSAPWSPAACRTTWCCRSRCAAAAARSARWRATNSAPSAASPRSSACWSSW